MVLKTAFTWYRIKPIIWTEFLHVLRNPIVISGMICFPFIQVILFSALFNFNSHHLPTALVINENSMFVRRIVQSLTNTHYFDIKSLPKTETEAEQLMLAGKIKFIINFPPGFSRDIVRGEKKPAMLLVADYSNPIEVTPAINAASSALNQSLLGDLNGVLEETQTIKPAFNLIIHERYNPGEFPFYYSIPAILTVAISLALLNFATDSIVTEVRSGTMESLLVTPARPIEVILAKMSPYFILGFLQLIAIIIMAHYLYSVPLRGSILLLILASLPTLIASILTGLIFSIITKNEFAAFELGNYYTLLSCLFSGLILPFYGMPVWAQWIGNLLPVTHLIRIIIGIMLKGSHLTDIWSDIWPTIIFMLLAAWILMKIYKRKFEYI